MGLNSNDKEKRPQVTLHHVAVPGAQKRLQEAFRLIVDKAMDNETEESAEVAEDQNDSARATNGSETR